MMRTEEKRPDIRGIGTCVVKGQSFGPLARVWDPWEWKAAPENRRCGGATCTATAPAPRAVFSLTRRATEQRSLFARVCRYVCCLARPRVHAQPHTEALKQTMAPTRMLFTPLRSTLALRRVAVTTAATRSTTRASYSTKPANPTVRTHRTATIPAPA